MPYRVLVVDDSSFFRQRVASILTENQQLEVVGFAVDGVDAVEKAIALKPDVITMDIEMPKLNGIDAVKQIMVKAPTAIIMFSSLTHAGAKATLDALDAGALDFLPKKLSEIAKNIKSSGHLLQQRVLQLAENKTAKNRSNTIVKKTPGTIVSSQTSLGDDVHQSRLNPADRKVILDKLAQQQRPSSGYQTRSRLNSSSRPTDVDVQKPIYTEHKKTDNKQYKLVAIGTSTGGPVALQQVLSKLPKDFPLPIIMVQHMPEAFTLAFAQRLNSLCSIEVKQAVSGDELKAGCAYLAPGGKQMLVEGSANKAKLKIIEDQSERILFKPSVDISFGSAAKIFGGDVLGIILTGMGTDGRDGCRLLKAKGARIWAQDEASCVIYGMPQAVTQAGIAELSIPLDKIFSTILQELNYG